MSRGFAFVEVAALVLAGRSSGSGPVASPSTTATPPSAATAATATAPPATTAAVPLTATTAAPPTTASATESVVAAHDAVFMAWAFRYTNPSPARRHRTPTEARRLCGPALARQPNSRRVCDCLSPRRLTAVDLVPAARDQARRLLPLRAPLTSLRLGGPAMRTRWCWWACRWCSRCRRAVGADLGIGPGARLGDDGDGGAAAVDGRPRRWDGGAGAIADLHHDLPAGSPGAGAHHRLTAELPRTGRRCQR